MSDMDHDDGSVSGPGGSRAPVLSAAQTTSPSQRINPKTTMPGICRRRVDHATEEEGLSGKRCLIENTDETNIVHYAHCLGRATDDDILDALEFSWGMDRKTLNLDTRYNIFRLGSKFHALYDKRSVMWLFLPEQDIIQNFYETRNDREEFPDFNEPTYNYHFLAHKDMLSVPIHRLTRHENLAVAPPAAAYTYFAHPYVNLGTIKSHVRPRFVICDAGKKIEESGTRAVVLSTLYPHHVNSIIMVGEIWKAWTTVADSEGFKAFYNKPYAGDNMSSTSQRTAKRRLPPLHKKRGRDPNESPSRGSKRSKAGQSQNDCIWLDDETLREHDSKDSPKAQWKNKKAWISDWTKVVGKTGIAVEQALDLDVVTDEGQTAQ